MWPLVNQLIDAEKRRSAELVGMTLEMEEKGAMVVQFIHAESMNSI